MIPHSGHSLFFIHICPENIFIFSGFTNHLPDCAIKPDFFFHLTLFQLLSEPLIRLIFLIALIFNHGNQR